ncbi:MAG: linear amide C-N hydrolase [Cognaticolwellia sp.]
MKKLTALSISTVFTLTISIAAEACTSIAWHTEKFGVITARNNDWSESTKPYIGTILAGTKRYLHGVKSSGQTYQTKYAIAGVLAYGGLVHDGLNSEGMSMNVLYYGPMTMGTEDKQGSLSQLSLGEYLLANYATVDEVVKQLPEIDTFSLGLPGLASPPQFHWSLTDKSGDRVIIEYDPAGLKIYRGKVAMIMTNQPSHQTHLDAWQKTPATKERAHSNVNFGSTGNTNPRDRYLHARYFYEQLEQPSSLRNGMMKLSTVASRIPHDAANKEINGEMAGYATEWMLTQSLETGDTVIEYTFGDKWIQYDINMYELIKSGKTINIPMDAASYTLDLTKLAIDLAK